MHVNVLSYMSGERKLLGVVRPVNGQLQIEGNLSRGQLWPEPGDAEARFVEVDQRIHAAVQVK